MLKELYGTRRDDDLEVALLRPRGEIAAMARKHCLAKDKRFAAHAETSEAKPESPAAGAGKMPRWRPAEIEMLTALYADLDNLMVARRLGRTVTSVANKANQLGLRKSPGLLARIGRTNVGLRYGRPATEGVVPDAEGGASAVTPAEG